MRRFKFKLEKYLDVTRRKKDDAERKFADATRVLEEARARLQELLAEMEKARREYAEHTAAGKRVKVGLLLMYTNFFAYKRQQIEQQQQYILECQAARQKRLKELLALMSRLKSIEQLKAKRWQQYQAEVLAEEAKTLDEIGLQLFTRQREPQEASA